ncbi:MAG: hypothetical protein U1E67_00210 [Hyphomicrobiales bacterium]
MDQYDPDSGLRLAWIGTPLRKRLDETLEMPLPWDIAQLIAGSEVDPDSGKQNPPDIMSGG